MNISKFNINSNEKCNKIIIGTQKSLVFKKNSALGDIDFKILNQAKDKNIIGNLSFNEIINEKKLSRKKMQRLIANVNGWFYRIKYIKFIKDKLIKEQNNLYELYSKQYSNILKVFSDVEKFYKKTYDSNRWKEFYTENDYLNNYIIEDDYRRSFFTKILIGWTEDNNEYFYSGSLNIRNQKNGRGLLITKEAKYEGNWLNDELHGWGMITNSEGFIYEGIA